MREAAQHALVSYVEDAIVKLFESQKVLDGRKPLKRVEALQGEPCTCSVWSGACRVRVQCDGMCLCLSHESYDYVAVMSCW